jgi:hypothetical protein
MREGPITRLDEQELMNETREEGGNLMAKSFNQIKAENIYICPQEEHIFNAIDQLERAKAAAGGSDDEDIDIIISFLKRPMMFKEKEEIKEIRRRYSEL